MFYVSKHHLRSYTYPVVPYCDRSSDAGGGDGGNNGDDGKRARCVHFPPEPCSDNVDGGRRKKSLGYKACPNREGGDIEHSCRFGMG